MVIHELDRMIEVDLLRRGVTAYRHTQLEGEVGHDGFRQLTEMEVPEIIGAEPLATQLGHFVDLVRGEVDAEAERASILPPHRLVEEALSAHPPLRSRGTYDGVPSSCELHPGDRAGRDTGHDGARGTSWVTTAPAPTTASSPMVTPMVTTALAPRNTRSPITTGLPVDLVVRGVRSRSAAPSSACRSARPRRRRTPRRCAARRSRRSR